MITSTNTAMKFGCLPSRRHILVAILLVLVLQLVLWVFVAFKPSNNITIYLSRSMDGRSQLAQNQIDFKDAISIGAEQGHHVRSRGNKTFGKREKKKRVKGGFLAKLDALKHGQLREGDDASKHDPEKNVTHPVLLERAKLIKSQWSEETRQRLLKNLEPSLITQDLSPLSDSCCSIADVEAPPSLCGHFDWDCSHSPTYTQHHRRNRTLTISCPGDFRIYWYFERNGGLTSDVMKNYTNQYSTWSHVTKPINIPFPTQYADILCRIHSEDGPKVHHNYRTQFIPNRESVVKQHKIFHKKKEEQTDWQPLSILSINVDSLSRAQFHRSCGLPRTKQLLQGIFNASNDSSHQAFLFNRMNSIGGVTAMNLTPLYAGIYFKQADEEKRVRIHRYTKPIKEWMWDYANQHGYLTSYAMDTGNGIMGTRTICPECNHLPVELPHWEHDWVKMENKEMKPGVLSGLCDGDTMIHEHIMNFTRDLINYDYPAKWAAFDLNAKHRPEQESANQVDALLADTLQSLMATQPNLAIFLFGDHGDRYHGDDANHPGSYMEILLPFLAIILPKHLINSHPEWERNLLINSQRYVVHYDLHQTMKSLMDYPHLDNVKGHIVEDSYNLITQIIPSDRGCAEAMIPSWSCACGGPTILTRGEWTENHISYAQQALDVINTKHSKESLLAASPNGNTSTSCMDLHFDSLVTVAKIHHDYARLQITMYIISFDAVEGPSRWDLRITEDGHIDSLKQLSRYQKYEECLDPRVSIEFCVCKQFPPGTP
ncbi:uncharacterized protein LOC579826 [Strongylocentrotus purpuratus]|uniref:Uncharacterized protein n=1 Tax=Strongylocentrotus purpuratus TaxID=7668 RepID=A0A7M7LSW3_STRPU|nr:uncharacterized protein LOC579826 [Strongylocentrotus purpuratus]